MEFELTRRASSRQLISLVPMIDVMLILLVFFMVTSTYLNLDMIPLVEPAETAPAPAPSGTGSDSATLFIRIGADGRAYIRGEALDPPALAAHLRSRLAENALLSVVLLPSSRATTQDLVTTMDTLTRAGAQRLRLLRLEAAQ